MCKTCDGSGYTRGRVSYEVPVAMCVNPYSSSSGGLSHWSPCWHEGDIPCPECKLPPPRNARGVRFVKWGT